MVGKLKEKIILILTTFFVSFIVFGVIILLMWRNYRIEIESVENKAYLEGQNSLLIDEVKVLRDNYFTLSEKIKQNMTVLASTIIEIYNYIDSIRSQLDFIGIKIGDLEVTDEKIYEVLDNINNAFNSQYDAFKQLYDSFSSGQ